MAEDGDRSDEFVRFIKENRDMIMRILAEDEEEEAPESRRERFEETYVEPAKSAFKETSDTVLKVLADDDVQKHFVTGCMEMIMCLEAMVRALPLSDEMREVVDNAEKARDSVVRKAAVSGAVATTKSKAEKINVTNVKRKVSDKVEKVKEVIRDEEED